MSKIQILYTVGIIVIVLALVFDLGLLNKKHKKVTLKQAFLQTLLWVSLSFAFCGFIWYEEGAVYATKYISAYLMEWTLSIDNIFVFILIFSFFKVDEQEAGRALLVGILLAIIFRIIFIAVGVELIERFHWLLYLFGAFLVYTGIKLFVKKEEEEYNPQESIIYKWVQKIFPVSFVAPPGKYFTREHNRLHITPLAVVVLLLAGTDIVFALDSIPTVVSLVRSGPMVPFSEADIVVIYSSNIFAVLGLRSLFFLLRGAVDRFAYLQQGIAVVLVFVGVKMLIEYFGIHISIYISLAVIIACLGGSILYSHLHHLAKKQDNQSV